MWGIRMTIRYIQSLEDSFVEMQYGIDLKSGGISIFLLLLILLFLFFFFLCIYF